MTRPRQGGMTMVELLVALVIGVGVTLVVATVLVAGENHKRTTTSTNDADQTGAYAFYAIERYLRSAGSAIAESAYASSSTADAGVLGCKLNVTTILPATSFPAPFAGVLGGAASTLRVAPVLIASGQSAGGDANPGPSDVLIIMSGAGTGGGISRTVVSAGPTSSPPSLQIESAEGFKPHDYVLLSQSGLSAPSDCLLEEVNANQSLTAPTPPLQLQASATTGNPYYTAGTTTTLSTLVQSTTTFVTGLGNVAANDFQYQMIGVGSPDTLYGYDLLQYQNLALNQNIGKLPQAIADGVVAMYAIYGVAIAPPPNAGAGIFAYWVSPGDAGTYDISTVMNSETTMETIIAVRVGLIVRGEYYDKNIVSPSSLSVFSGLTDGITNAPVTKTVTLSATQQHYRYRTFEFTVPLRNMLILAGVS